MVNPFKNFFKPGPRGRLRWKIFGIICLFLVAGFFDILGFKNPASQGLDQFLSSLPSFNGWRFWPTVQVNSEDNSRVLVWKNIQEIDLAGYGWPFKLGLDLLGGTHLVYDADVSSVNSASRTSSVEGAREVIERRVNVLGVSEPLVQTNKVGDKWRIIVELAGVYDVKEAIAKIGETPLLEFKLESGQVANITPEQQAQLNEANKQVEAAAKAALAQILSGADFATLAKEKSEDPGSKDNGGLYQGVTKGMFVAEFDDVIFNKLKVGQIYPQLAKTQFGYHIIKKEGESGVGDERKIDTRHILFKFKTPADLGIAVEPEWKNTELSGRHLQRAQVLFDQNSNVPQVGLEFNDEGKKLFGEITKDNAGKLLAIFLDGYPISIPKINEPILSGQAVITGNFSIKEANLLAQRLNAGALPVPITLVSQTNVGATLGSESINKSLIAGVWGLILVAIFMILYYRLPGLMAVLALLVYTSVSLFVFKLAGVTLTLAGIAGFILSIGMAVDANVLIFERLKEELKAGRDLFSAIEEAFPRAWSSIRDSNISSLITCAILYWFGSSIIKGFALTLALGILVSMFSAIVITHQFLRLIAKWRISKVGWFYGVRKKKSL